MLSYTGRRNLFGTLTQNTTSTNLTTGDTLMNAAEKRILALNQWPFLQTSDTKTTTASTQFYQIPQRIEKLETISVTSSSVTYTPIEVSNEMKWQDLNSTTVTGTVPTHFFKRGNQIGLFPIPSTTMTINFFGRRGAKDLTIADYTTGTITSITNGATTVTGSGTTWTAGMVGQFIKITDGSAANSGDGYWYEIASRASNTSLDLVKPYGGTSIAAGTAAYTIGQMSLLPEAYQDLPVFDAVKFYYASIEKDMAKFQMYDQMYNKMEARLMNDYSIHTGEIILSADQPNYE